MALSPTSFGTTFATVLGDAGTATLCTAVPEDEDWFSPSQFWGWVNGERADIIRTPKGGSRDPLRSGKDVENWQHCLSMDGRAVKEIIVPLVGGPAAEEALAKAGWSMDQLDLVTLHEANLVLNEAIVKMWRARGFRGEVLSAGGRFGNTTSASIPLAWTLNPEALTVGKNFGLAAFGGGYLLIENGHIIVDVIVTHFPFKVRKIIDLITSVLFFLGVGVIF